MFPHRGLSPNLFLIGAGPQRAGFFYSDPEVRQLRLFQPIPSLNSQTLFSRGATMARSALRNAVERLSEFNRKGHHACRLYDGVLVFPTLGATGFGATGFCAAGFCAAGFGATGFCAAGFGATGFGGGMTRA